MKRRKKATLARYTSVLLILLWFIPSINCFGSNDISKEEATMQAEDKKIAVTELDLGDYLTEMKIDEKQLLSVTILPFDATVQEITYASSEPSIASINGMGRITAHKEGQVTISATCDEITETFQLKVSKPEEDILVTQIDVGDCPKEIVIGSSQILSVAAIPVNATNASFAYSSSNEEIADVNPLGRITAHKLGKTTITVKCGSVKEKFQVTVVEDTTLEKEIPVTDIEIADYEEKLGVDDTMNISATVLPSDATDGKITYMSSNRQIATVNSTGEVKGICKGQVIIYVSSGSVKREIPLNIIVKTSAIELNEDYLVLKPNDTFSIKPQVKPQEANQGITYKSLDSSVASVSATGIITAKKIGSTAIIVSNDDLQVSVTVIVNEESTSVSSNGEKTFLSEEIEDIKNSVTVSEYPILKKEILKRLYENKEKIAVKGDNYTLYIDGEDIVNYENELDTILLFQEENSGFIMNINGDNKLCGNVSIDLSEKISSEKFLYLYNQDTKKYQRISVGNIKLLTIDSNGTYLFTTKKIDGFQIKFVYVAIGLIVILSGVGIYIGVKKQYWFW